MAFSRVYTVPDYYGDFICKGPDCRHSCCVGWPISISMKEYFTLLGIECSTDLRTKLDRSFRLAKNPCEFRYAQIAPDPFTCDCHMHLSNGWCMLHKELGEDSLPLICRYYPRGPRSEYAFECSMSNSCEKVLELLLQKKDMLTFCEKRLTFEGEECAGDHNEAEKSFYKTCRKVCINILQKRACSLPDRLIISGYALKELYELQNRKEYDKAEQVAAKYINADFVFDTSSFKADLPYAINILRELTVSIALDTMSMGEYAAKILSYYGLADEPTEETISIACRLYLDADRHLREIMPEWERHFEQLLINHIFFEQFPFSDKHENLKDEYFSLSATYGFLRFATLGYMADKTDINDFIDLMVAAFRLIDHSCFDRNSAIIMRELDCYSIEKIPLLVKA